MSTQRPLLDFHAPCLATPVRLSPRTPRFLPQRRCASTHSSDPPKAKPTSSDTPVQLSQEQRDFLDGAVGPPLTPQRTDTESLSLQLRVNQAGELAATLIYAAQTPPIVRAHPHLHSVMKHMYEQEAGHLKTFNALLAKHRIRPTALTPLWTVAATALGWSTALMGRQAAMACTEAVETEIGEHYNNQVREILRWRTEMKARGEDIGGDLESLLETLKKTRDEELEHLDTAVAHDAKRAQPYELLTAVIRGGCRGAIWLTNKV